MNRERAAAHRLDPLSLPLILGARLISEAENEGGVLQLDDSRRVLLNEFAARVLSRCDGTHSAEEIADEMRGARDEVLAFIAAAIDLGWIHPQHGT